jgi:2-methylcitrate dehydratase PrpD
VECQVDPAALDILTYAEPATSLQAKFSMQFCLAAALLRRRVSLAEFTPELLSSAVIRELMGRITMRSRSERGDAILGTTPDTVVVRLKDGREYRHGVARARGHAELPLTQEELVSKYRQCATPVLGEASAKRSLNLMESFEELKDISELMDIVIAAPSPTGCAETV